MIRFFLILMFLSFTTVYSQKIDNDTLISNIKKDVTLFFIDQGVLDKEAVKNNLNFVFVNEIFDEKVIGFNQNGIYSIGVFQSHSKKHILIKEGSNYIIYNLKNIEVVLKEVIDYAIRNGIENDKLLYYVKNIIQRYDDNYNYKHTSIEEKN